MSSRGVLGGSAMERESNGGASTYSVLRLL